MKSTLIVNYFGDKAWVLSNGDPHRVDGPAVERFDGTREWYLWGRELTETQIALLLDETIDLNTRLETLRIELGVALSDSLVAKRSTPKHSNKSEPGVDRFGNKVWRLPDGRLHREDGPAFRAMDGIEEWYLWGERLTNNHIFILQDKSVDLDSRLKTLKSVLGVVQKYDFSNGSGPVPANRHTNPDGSKGGWVAKTAWVSKTAHLGPNAKVYGNAKVYRNAKVYDKARVTGNAQIYGNAHIYGNAVIAGNAHVFGDVHVSGGAHVKENARISGTIWICGDYARVSDAPTEIPMCDLTLSDHEE